MKRLLLILVPLLAIFGAGYWMFAKPQKETIKPPTTEEQAPQKTKKNLPRRSAPPSESAAVEFEDDPPGELRLEGQVVDEAGNGVVDAVVAVSSNPTKKVTSGANGWFAFEGLVARSYNLEARKDDLFGHLTTTLKADSTPVTLQMLHGGSLSLTVLDEVDRKPIAGAKVKIGDLAKTEAITDTQGKALLKGLGDWELLAVRAEGYGPYNDFVRTTSFRTVQEKTITLARGALVSGIVLDPTGAPAAGARVTVESNSTFGMFWGRNNDEEEKILTDEQGKWQIKAISAGTYRFRARHEKFAPGLSAPVTVDGKTPKEDVEIRLEEGSSLSGKVVSKEGNPVPSALVSVGKDSREPFSWEPNRKAFTNDKGEFLIEGLGKSPHQVVASFEEVFSDVIPVDLSNGDVKDVTLLLDQDGSITGVVVTSKGEPVSDAEVMGTPQNFADNRNTWRLRGFPRTVSDPDGNFVLRGLSVDEVFVLSASTPNQESATPWNDREKATMAKTGDQNVRIVLQEFGSIKGKVAFSDGSIPKSYQVSAGWNDRTTFSNEDGSFEIQKVNPGKVKITVSGSGIKQTTSPQIEVTAGSVTDAGTITVEKGRAIRGKVYAQDGTPVGGATVMAGARIAGDGAKLSDNPRAQSRQTVSLEDGSFEVGGLGPDEFYLVADHPTLGRSAMLKLPASEADVSQDLSLLPTGALEGKVTYNNGPAPAMLSLTSQDARGVIFRVRSGEDGLYRFDKLATGTYYLTASRVSMGGGRFSQGGAYTITVTVKDGETTKYDLDIPSGVTVSITPTLDGAPVKNVSASLLKGSVSVTDSKALEQTSEAMSPDAVRNGVVMDIPMVNAEAIKIEDVQPGQYSLCVSRLPPFNEIRDGTADMEKARPVICVPLTVAESPATQEFTQEVPK